jgi:hypothetical protein
VTSLGCSSRAHEFDLPFAYAGRKAAVVTSSTTISGFEDVSGLALVIAMKLARVPTPAHLRST